MVKNVHEIWMEQAYKEAEKAFNEEELPIGQMWEDDRYWLPLLVKGIKFQGVFEFTSDSKKLISYNIEKL